MRILFLLCIFCVGNIAFAQKKKAAPFFKPKPQPEQVVNDYGKFLTVGEQQFLEEALIKYRQNSGNSIVIITLSSLTDPRTGDEYTVEETALMYFNKWGIGDNVKNNGVLILLSRNPRRVRITTGMGIEGILTNNICQRIIDEQMVPAFKAGLFFDGLKKAVGEIENKLDDAAPPQKKLTALPPELISPPQPVVSRQPDEPITIGEIFQGILGLLISPFILYWTFKLCRGTGSAFGGVFSGGGYRNYNINYNNNNNSSGGWFSGRRSFYSGGSSSGGSSSSSSSSSSSGSFGGGMSRGGGASGSW